ncbi:MAG: signal peptidase I [Lachnospiraceae bacterium]|nr:signal peptidase I [Lachnospiraceae bacterium]MCI8780559.1 signal peptidase I [Lachnospiraceae bacterium]
MKDVETVEIGETSDEKESSSEEVTQEKESKEKNSKASFIKELLVYAVIIILCVTIVPRYVIQRTQVDGRSMMNTLHDEESLLVEKVTYHFKNPDRFDIITFYPQGRDHEEYYIKRVIGLPGETVQITGNTIYIDGEVLKESYGREPMESGGIAEEPIKLGEDEFFVLGDNRNESIDSRDGDDVGVVNKKNIDGHAILRIYPFSEFGIIGK